ncbi:MAG: OmpA family protein [Bradyrhizobiaceae bacterium]|nr:OmpA family protein [Bradyrhizobiaceae bacterium]
MTTPLTTPSRFILALVLALCCAGTSSAQLTLKEDSTARTKYLRLFVGGYAALGINLHQASFGSLPGLPSCCSEYRDATSLIPIFAGLVEVPISTNLRLQTRLGYSALNGSLQRQEAIGNEPVLDDGPIPTENRVDIQVEHRLDASAPMVVLEPTVGYQIWNFLWLSVGGRAGWAIGNSYNQRETLFTPEGYTFLDGTTIRNHTEGSIPDFKSLQFHGVLGLGYELFTNSPFSLVPEVRYYIPFTKVSSVDWAVSAFQLGVSFRYGIYTPDEQKVIRDTVIWRDTVIVEKPNRIGDQVFLASTTSEDSVRDEGDLQFVTTHVRQSYVRETPRPFTPDVNLQFVAVGPSGEPAPLEAIRVQELEVIENYPLLPQVFFAKNSASMDSVAQLRYDEEQASDFSVKELFRNQLDVYHNLLNVVGMRMKEKSGATLTLTGATDNEGEEKNNRELALQRATAVKDYLTSAFGIDPSRIKVTARGGLPDNPANPITIEGMAENRRVDLTSNDPSILEPVEFKDKDLVITPKAFTIKPTVKGGQDIAKWEAQVVQGLSKLASGKGEGRPTSISWDADSSSSLPRNDKPIIATYTVSNEIGQSRTSTDTLDVDYVTAQLMKASREGGKLIERYSLIVFDFNSAQLNAANQRVMDRVKSRIQPESKVHILGYADRQGNAEYNRNLARKRCVEAQRALGIPDSQVTIEPIGSDKLLYDNDLAEGRSYSRTVQIVIETPVR